MNARTLPAVPVARNPMEMPTSRMSLHGDTSQLSAALLAVQFSPALDTMPILKRLMAEGVTPLQWVQGREGGVQVVTTLMCGCGALTLVTDHADEDPQSARAAAEQWLIETLGLTATQLFAPQAPTQAERPVAPEAQAPSAVSLAVEPPAPADMSAEQAQAECALSESAGAPVESAATSEPPAESPVEPSAATPTPPAVPEEPAGLSAGERNQITRLKAAVDAGTCTTEKARASLSEGGVSFSRLSPLALNYARALILGEPLRPALASIDLATGF